MKRISILFSLVLLLSCSDKKDDPTPQSLAPASTITASVDGKDWTSAQAEAVVANGTITIAGVASDGSQLVISVTATKTGKYVVSGITGTTAPDHSVSFTPTNFNVSTNPLYASVYLAQSSIGEIEITEIDETNKTVSGTFTSKVMRMVPKESTIEIKSGSFTKIKYTTSSTVTPGNSASAKIDNAALSVTIVGGVVSFEKISLNIGNGTKSISISMPDNVVTGTYDLGQMGSTYSALYNASSTVIYESITGKLIISKHDKTAKRIEGKFNFNGELFGTGGGAVAVTDGLFAITYN